MAGASRHPLASVYTNCLRALHTSRSSKQLQILGHLCEPDRTSQLQARAFAVAAPIFTRVQAVEACALPPALASPRLLLRLPLQPKRTHDGGVQLSLAFTPRVDEHTVGGSPHKAAMPHQSNLPSSSATLLGGSFHTARQAQGAPRTAAMKAAYVARQQAFDNRTRHTGWPAGRLWGAHRRITAQHSPTVHRGHPFCTYVHASLSPGACFLRA